MKKENVTFILFGGTGDLTKRKLVPAFARLAHSGKLSKNSTIIGISRKELDHEEYKEFLCSGIKNKEDKEHIENLKIKYMRGEFDKEDGLKGIKELIESCESENSNRIYYLSTSYNFFGNIVKELKKQKLDKTTKGYTRIIFEKPFGSDFETAKKLDLEIHSVFSEENIYRIDHYLAKEMVQNLNSFKFTNPIIYNSFGNRNVESVEIIVDEDLSVGERINYYDGAGALKDMIQNHLLQVLSLVLMERPKSLNSEDIHDKKVEVLKNLEVMNAKEHLLGQYNSYKNELKKKCMKSSERETFAKIFLNCKMPRWDNVKLILRTGKMLKKKFTQIRINFTQAEKKFTNDYKGVGTNKILIDIYPDQNIYVSMNARVPEEKSLVKPVNFTFSRQQAFGANTVDEYSTLLGDVISGERTLFAREDEVLECWKIVDKIEAIRSKIKFVNYKDGSDADDIV